MVRKTDEIKSNSFLKGRLKIKNKYRYILSGTVDYKDPISVYRLVSHNQLGRSSDVIRVTIPDDMKINKSFCDNYSKTEDTRTLEELECDILIRLNGKWIIRNDLKKYQPYEFYEVLTEKENLYCTAKGYFNNKH